MTKDLSLAGIRLKSFNSPKQAFPTKPLGVWRCLYSGCGIKLATFLCSIKKD